MIGIGPAATGRSVYFSAEARERRHRRLRITAAQADAEAVRGNLRPDGANVQLELLEERRFASGFVYLRYRTTG